MHVSAPRPELSCRPATPDELRRWVETNLGLKLPARGVCPGHAGPFEYLLRAYFEPAEDLVVWAPRGGGKTRLAAAATLLDMLYKPPCAVRILGGSLQQSLRMWEHLLPDVERLAGEHLSGRSRSRRIDLDNGSSVAVLTQSQRSVRGLRVQKMRCDEVELFDPRVWEAAQLVTRSREADGQSPAVRGTVEAISTLHEPFGLMERIVRQAEADNVRIIRWCVLEVLQRCPSERRCDCCPLLEDCRGIARTRCDGFVSIDDAVAMKRRVSVETWQAEMLCRRPAARNCVFPTFDPAVHVREEMPCAGDDAELWLAVDFGFANPFVCLWVRAGRNGTVHVIDEYVQEQRTIDEHVEHIRLRPWGRPARVACDPAGAARNEQTAMSDVQALRRAGWRVTCRHSAIVEGIEMIRAGLRPAAGNPSLFIHPRCQRLIRAMRSYRYSARGGELPLKDGTHDHLVDALRYFYVNSAGSSAAEGRRY